MNEETLYYLIIFGSVILAGISMVLIGIFTLKSSEKNKV